MAKKGKKKVEKKVEKSRILEVLAKEYKYENLILGILATAVAVISIFLIDGTFAFRAGAFDGGMFEVLENVLVGNEKTIGYSILTFSLLILITLLYPFFKPSIVEVKKVNFPKKEHVMKQTIRVLIFIGVLTILFVLLGLLFQYLLVEVMEVV